MKWATEWIAILYTLAYFAMVFCVMFIPHTDEIPASLQGIMSAAQLAIIQYYFGASKIQSGGSNENPKPMSPPAV